jgi:hypothetical protein
LFKKIAVVMLLQTRYPSHLSFIFGRLAIIKVFALDSQKKMRKKCRVGYFTHTLCTANQQFFAGQ